jgi:hypothetical protein
MSSLIPDAIDALLAMAETALPGVQVLDGPEAEWPEMEYIAIGLSPEDLENPSTRTAAGTETTSESAEIIGMIRVWSGDDDIRPLRQRAYELLRALRDATEADNRLGGAVDQVELTGHIYAPGASHRGRWVDLLPTWQVMKF